MKYCPLCRSDLVNRPVDGAERLACSSFRCKFVCWDNPIPVVAGLVQYEGQYVLARNVAWQQGMFSVITGFLERDESPDAAVIRETEEELGLRSRQCTFIGHFPLPQANQLIIAFMVDAYGKLNLNEEIAEVKVVALEQLAVFDFGRLQLTCSIVARWLQMPEHSIKQTPNGVA